MSVRMPRPPRLAEWLLGLVLPVGVIGRSILGDAREEFAEYVRKGGFAPAVWYWIHAARLAGGYVVTRGRGVEMGTILKDLKFGARSHGNSSAVTRTVLTTGSKPYR